MIQKILHFIWFGNFVPKYVNFSIDAFKKINNDFQIHFIYYRIKDIENLHIKNKDDEILEKCLHGILSNNQKYQNIINHCKKNNLRFIQILSDIYRLEILNYYGGIYLDCDCFPIKRFDKNLLSKDFIVQRHYPNNSIDNDNYFFGIKRNNEMWDIFDIEKTKHIRKLLQTKKSWYTSIKYFQLKKRFINCQLKFGEFISTHDFYVDHYSLKTWKDNGNGIQTPTCIFDKHNVYQQ